MLLTGPLTSVGHAAYVLRCVQSILACCQAKQLSSHPPGYRRRAVVAGAARHWVVANTTFASVVLLTAASLPIGRWLLLPLENTFAAPVDLPEQVEGVLVLGGPVELDISVARAQPHHNESAERIPTLIELGRRYPSARLVFTGGGAAIACNFYERQGFDVSRIIFEGKARNTFENATFTRRLVQPQPGERWILVTSARHMPRAAGVFRQVGWSVIPYPVDYRTTGAWETLSEFDLARGLRDLDLGAKEWIGLVAYRFARYAGSLVPN